VTARIRQGRGFTLIEVLVALFIVALGIGALLATLTSAATTVDHLRDKSFAQWIALNQITQARLASTSAGTGSSSGEVDYAGNKWYWRQQVVDQGIAGMRRIDVPNRLPWRLPWVSWGRNPSHPMAGLRRGQSRRRQVRPMAEHRKSRVRRRRRDESPATRLHAD
jgi:general secretion pathway protein I